ncbi:MAG: relaxase/mobilization nuclease domain-containing protein [Oscillospiraceae bacterium]|nr:relaxase/mobilization nuclease domain-containing protein [Oscillospiraceae bacterium]
MAVTSLWRVNGWLGKVVIYIENPDKTENPAFYEKQNMSEKQAQGLSDVIEYAVNSKKTAIEDGEIMQSFVSGVNCFPGTARQEMLAVKRQYGKENGTVAYHGYQSFAPGEATPEIVHEIGVKLAQRLWGNRYQVLVATHLDRANHLHNHFVLNTVSFVDGIKYHRTLEDYKAMREVSDELCREYGLSVIENPLPGRAESYAMWKAKKEGRPARINLVKDDVDEAIRQSMTMTQFWNCMKEKGYEVSIKKLLYLKPPGSPCFYKIERRFGYDYSVAGITERILMNRVRERPLPEPERQSRRVPYKGSVKNLSKATGFRALYYHYCFLLGYFPKNKPRSNRRLHFLLREDLLKMDAIAEEVRLLARCHIDTGEQLSSYKESLEKRISSVTAERKSLYKSQRTVAVKNVEGKLAKVKEEIAARSAELKKLRKEVRLCDDIAARSGVMLEKLRVIREEEKAKEKEETKRDEQFRRRGGTGR